MAWAFMRNIELVYATIEKPSAWLQTGTAHCSMDEEMTMNVYCNIVQALKLGAAADDGVQKLYLDTAAGAHAAKKRNLFHELKERINVPVSEMSKLEQERCIYDMPMSTFHKIAGNTSKRMSDKAMSQIASMYEDNVTCKAVHILFHWNAHSFFKYHQVPDGDVVAIVNLSHSNATMHVAGRTEAIFDGIGWTHIFLVQVFHRSGAAQRRCVKVAFVFKLEGSLYPENDKKVGHHRRAQEWSRKRTRRTRRIVSRRKMRRRMSRTRRRMRNPRTRNPRTRRRMRRRKRRRGKPG
jgi:hypothetical protein